MSSELAEALYLKAKALLNDEDSPNTTAFATVKKSLHIWTNTPLTGGPKDLNHAMALVLKATMLKQMKKYAWAIKVYRKSS